MHKSSVAYHAGMISAAGIHIRRVSTAQQVADALADLIMSGGLPSGAPIRESVMAPALGVSRNTVREAVRILELGGLVRHQTHRGAVVIAPSPGELVELYRARMHLEIAAVQQPYSSADLQPVRDAYTAFETAAHRGEPDQTVQADLAFHAAIVDLLQSDRISAFYRQLTTELRYFVVVLSAAEGDYAQPERLLDDHRPILDALQAHDTARAVDAVRRHVEGNAARLQQLLDQRAAHSRTTDTPPAPDARLAP